MVETVGDFDHICDVTDSNCCLRGEAVERIVFITFTGMILGSRIRLVLLCSLFWNHGAATAADEYEYSSSEEEYEPEYEDIPAIPSCPSPHPKALNVHIVCHTHLDPGWTQTYDEYYTRCKLGIFSCHTN